MNINGTLLALQMMNGAKVYAVRYMDVGTDRLYSYKSAEDLEVGDIVVVPRVNGLSIAEVMREEDDVNFDATYALKWIVMKLDGVEDRMKANAEADKKAKAKLVKSKAQTAAQEYLKAAGLDVKDVLELEDKS